MLHLYSDLDYLPEGVEYIRDNVDFFMRVTVFKIDKDVDKLLVNTDKAIYQDEYYFKDRFGCSVPWECLSAGGMTVLNVYYNQDKCFDTLECGMNALTDIKNLKRGRVFPIHMTCEDGVDEIDITLDDMKDWCYTSYRRWESE